MQRRPPPLDSVVLSRVPFTHRIDSVAGWTQLAARPESQAIARTEIVKFLIDLPNDRTIWFVDTARFPIHYDFAYAHLSTDAHSVRGGWQGHKEFNEREYRQPDRRFVMGTLVHYLDQDLWTFEMIAGDTLDGPQVLRAFHDIQSAVFFGDALRYRPISPLHEAQTASVASLLPTVGTDEVFRNVRYQPLTLGTAFGTLRIVRGPLDQESVRPNEVLVLEELPDEIPVVSAVISQPLQAPLGHLAILCGTRGTPNMGLRGALSHHALSALEGQLVALTVAAQDFSIRRAGQSEAEQAWLGRRPTQILTPRLEARDRGLLELCSVGDRDMSSVGAKAAQLGEICELGKAGPLGIETPRGFVVPFHEYLAHLDQARLSTGIDAMLADQGFQSDPRLRAQHLADLRAAIQRSPVSPRLLHALRARIARFPGSPRLIFRSSTNAEDLPGFTGAGLYRSVVVPENAHEMDVADALKEVWASVWLLGAHEERSWYRIDHRRVAMAVLIQPFLDGAVANGVALTANPYFEGRPGFFVNAQALGGSVTGAAGDEVPEQWLLYNYQGFEMEALSRSSRSPGELLLGEHTLRGLHDTLAVLHRHFTPRWRRRWGTGAGPEPETVGGDRQAMAAEVEFLLTGEERRLVILQARPYVVRYTSGQQ